MRAEAWKQSGCEPMPAPPTNLSTGDVDTYRHQVPPVWAERCGEGSLDRLIKLVCGGHGVRSGEDNCLKRNLYLLRRIRSQLWFLEAPVWERGVGCSRGQKAKPFVEGCTCNHWTIPVSSPPHEMNDGQDGNPSGCTVFRHEACTPVTSFLILFRPVCHQRFPSWGQALKR